MSDTLQGLRDSKCQGHSGSMCKEPEVFRVSYQEHNKVTGSNREVLEASAMVEMKKNDN